MYDTKRPARFKKKSSAVCRRKKGTPKSQKFQVSKKSSYQLQDRVASLDMPRAVEQHPHLEVPVPESKGAVHLEN